MIPTPKGEKGRSHYRVFSDAAQSVGTVLNNSISSLIRPIGSCGKVPCAGFDHTRRFATPRDSSRTPWLRALRVSWRLPRAFWQNIPNARKTNPRIRRCSLLHWSIFATSKNPTARHILHPNCFWPLARLRIMSGKVTRLTCAHSCSMQWQHSVP